MKLFIVFANLLLVSIRAQVKDNICLTEECIETAAMIATSIDHNANPCDNFYQYACGNWLKDHPAPNDNNGWSHWSKLTNDMIENLLKILQTLSTQKNPQYLDPLINFFKGCTNTTEHTVKEMNNYNEIKSIIKKFGGSPLMDPNWNETNYSAEDALTELNNFIYTKLLLDIEIGEDLYNNSNSIISITNPFLPLLQVQGNYIKVNDFDRQQEYYDGVKANNQQVFETIRGSEVNQTIWDEEIKLMQAFDQALRASATQLNSSYIIDNYHSLRVTVKDLDKYEGLNLRKILTNLLKAHNITIHDSDFVLIPDVKYITNIGPIFKNTTKKTIANYIALQVGMILGKFTTFRMNQLVTNLQTVAQLPVQCLQFGIELFPDLMGRVYMDHAFAKESIADMKTFIATLRRAFHEVLAENDWMDNSTKTHAINKLMAITEHIAFPEYASNDTKLLAEHKAYLGITDENFLDTMVKIFNIQRKDMIESLLEHSMPEGHWPAKVSGVVVNAFYNPQLNAIFFPAGIAQPPFYQHTRTLTANLGAIGSVIGHEFTHGFDSAGSLFDEKGNLKNWFTADSRQNFSQRAACYVNQYNQFHYEITPGLFLNISGALTINENIADNGGIKVAFRAFETEKQKNNGSVPKMPGDLSSFSEEQIFFLSFANMWCTNRNANAIVNQIRSDVHSVANARVVGTLANFDEFAKAFKCPLGSTMNPQNKCLLW